MITCKKEKNIVADIYCFSLLASSHGHIQCVKLILRQPGVDIHAKDRWEATALTEAIKYGHDRVVQCLIRHGASWGEDGAGDLLCTAVAKNDIEQISRLVSLGVDVNSPNSDGNCAIHVASKLGSRAVVQYLIDQRAEINTIDSSGNAPLNYADMHEHRAVSQLLESLGARRVSRHYSIQEICEVASTGNLQMLRHMVHNGASICYRDVNHRTPLHVSSAEGHLDVVKFLVLQPGIDINAQDRNQFTPLLEAIVNKHHEVAEFLKSHGAVINECKLASLVTEKARSGDTKCLKRILRWSGHVNTSDFDGQTALHVAAMNGRVDVVSMLLREGADATLVNRFNKTALELASSFQHSSVEKELRKHLKVSTLSEDTTHADDTISCYQRKSKGRRRKYKTEPSTYHYSERPSWSSTDMSTDARKHLESSASTDNTSQQMLSMRDVQKHQDNNVLRPSFLRVMPVSQLSPQTRELKGGQPDYV